MLSTLSILAGTSYVIVFLTITIHLRSGQLTLGGVPSPRLLSPGGRRGRTVPPPPASRLPIPVATGRVPLVSAGWAAPGMCAWGRLPLHPGPRAAAGCPEPGPECPPRRCLRAMALQLLAHFDVREDVLPSLPAQPETTAGGGGADVLETTYESLRVLNIERNGNIIYTYKDNKGNAVFGLYDCQARQNEHLYTFEKDMQAVSCSVNSARTVLAASFIQYTKEGVRNELHPGSKCLTLLVDTHPVNNVKVLKAVDSCIWVQFLYPHAESHHLQNHLLLISEEKYIERFHIQMTREDGNRVIRNSSHLPRDRIVEDFVWAQWDMSEQRLYYIELKKSKSILKCIQFWADEGFNLMFEMPLDMSLSGLGFKLVNFGYDYRQDQEKFCSQPSLCIFTNHTGSLCVCYSPKIESGKEITYSVFYLHKGYRKTFTAAAGSADSHVTEGITFLNLGYFVAVYLPGHFLHLLNTHHPDLICHSLFLTGSNKTAAVLPLSPLQSLPGSLILDWHSGKVYRAALDQSYLMSFLWNARLDCEKMAALHCVLSCGRDPGFPEGQILQWVSEQASTCHSFDLIQEFLTASSYWSVYPELADVDMLLPYSSVLTWDAVSSKSHGGFATLGPG